MRYITPLFLIAACTTTNIICMDLTSQRSAHAERAQRVEGQRGDTEKKELDLKLQEYPFNAPKTRSPLFLLTPEEQDNLIGVIAAQYQKDIRPKGEGKYTDSGCNPGVSRSA